jgi:hypothetical protein
MFVLVNLFMHQSYEKGAIWTLWWHRGLKLARVRLLQALGLVHGAKIVHAPEAIHGRLR